MKPRNHSGLIFNGLGAAEATSSNNNYPSSGSPSVHLQPNYYYSQPPPPPQQQQQQPPQQQKHHHHHYPGPPFVERTNSGSQFYVPNASSSSASPSTYFNNQGTSNSTSAILPSPSLMNRLPSAPSQYSPSPYQQNGCYLGHNDFSNPRRSFFSSPDPNRNFFLSNESLNHHRHPPPLHQSFVPTSHNSNNPQPAYTTQDLGSLNQPGQAPQSSAFVNNQRYESDPSSYRSSNNKTIFSNPSSFLIPEKAPELPSKPHNQPTRNKNGTAYRSGSDTSWSLPVSRSPLKEAPLAADNSRERPKRPTGEKKASLDLNALSSLRISEKPKTRQHSHDPSADAWRGNGQRANNWERKPAAEHNPQFQPQSSSKSSTNPNSRFKAELNQSKNQTTAATSSSLSHEDVQSTRAGTKNSIVEPAVKARAGTTGKSSRKLKSKLRDRDLRDRYPLFELEDLSYPAQTVIFCPSVENPKGSLSQLLQRVKEDAVRVEIPPGSPGSPHFALGFDMEWAPTFKKGSPEKKTAVIQIGGKSLILVIQVSMFQSWYDEGVMPLEITEFLIDPTIIKLGVGIQGDGSKLLRDSRSGPKPYLNSFLELGHLAQTLDQERFPSPDRSLISLQKIVAYYLSRYLSKDERMSKWDDRLNERQLKYAACDVVAAIRVFQNLLDWLVKESLKSTLEADLNPYISSHEPNLKKKLVNM